MTVSRVTVVLNTMPETQTRIDEVVAAVVDVYKPECDEYSYAFVADIPQTLPIHEADQLRAAKRDAGPDGQYLVVWMK